MNTERLKKEQLELAKKIIINNTLKKVDTIAGCEILGMDNTKLVCCIAVFELETLKLLDHAIVTEQAPMRYLAGYLGFREGPVIVNCFTKLKEKPDVLMIKGHGIAHPRRIGIASQLGLQLGVPTIGIATKLLCGRIAEDKIMVDGEVRGSVIKTREFSNPIFVSPGHNVSLNQAVGIARKCIVPPHKMPEPIFIAHKLANKFKKQ